MPTSLIVVKGDTVRLKSGGPKMTVQVTSQNLVYCVWFDEEATRKEGSFELDTLEKVDPDPTPSPN